MLGKLKLSILIVSFLVLAALPIIAEAVDEPFYIDLMARVMIFSIAAMSLDFILGYGAMISFGHALYIGLGTYAVGILAFYEVTNGWLQLLVCVVGTAMISCILGLISLRTSGIYFIMITFALAQMFYFLGISLEAFGGDDGLPIEAQPVSAALSHPVRPDIAPFHRCLEQHTGEGWRPVMPLRQTLMLVLASLDA